MKNIAITIFIVLVVTILGLYLFSFQVRETQSVLVTTFGNPTRQITEPGVYFIWPRPIQRVHKFDSRMRVLEADVGETTTKGAVPIIVNTYVVWRIAEPLQYLRAVGTLTKAEVQLHSQISDTQNTVIGRYSFGEFVNSDPAKIKFSQIEEEMLTYLQQAVADADYGIEIKTLGIKQLKISKDVTQDVFKRMTSKRERRTKTTIAEGTNEADRIKTDAELKRIRLLATAKATAKAIRGQGDAEAAKYYKMLEEDPDLAMFLQDIEAIGKILGENVTFVLSADAEPLKLLMKMPDIKPRDPNEPEK